MSLSRAIDRRQTTNLTKNLRRRHAAVMRNPTLEGAMEFWRFDILGLPPSSDAVLAGVHKARLRWPPATAAMVAESRAWLAAHGFDEEIADQKAAKTASGDR